MMKAEEFINELRTWIGTPYMRDACVKKRGTNCSLFVLDAAEKILNVKGEPHLRSPHIQMLRKDPLAVVTFLDKIGRRISFDEIRPGDLAVATMAMAPCQILVYTGDGKFIYSSRSLGVVEDKPPQSLLGAITHAYRLSALDDE